MSVQIKSGKLVQKQGKGTPQGGVINPMLANLFLQYAMDKWLEQTHPTVSYVRYADDAILHCRNKAQAEDVLETLTERMHKCGLELHPEKTKLVYCREYRQQQQYEVQANMKTVFRLRLCHQHWFEETYSRQDIFKY